MDLEALIDEIDFANNLAEKRNDKILATLGKIIGELSKPQVQVNEVNLNKLENLVAQIRQPDFSQLDKITKSMDRVVDIMIDKLNNLKEEKKPTEWTFQVYRDKDGLMKHVKAKATLN